MIIKNLNQFKKAMRDGHMFEIIEHFVRPEFTGQKRYVSGFHATYMYTKVQEEDKINTYNNGKGIYLNFGKASDWAFCNGICQQKKNGKPIWTLRVLDEKVKVEEEHMKNKIMSYIKANYEYEAEVNDRFFYGTEHFIAETEASVGLSSKDIDVSKLMDNAVNEAVSKVTCPSVPEIKENIRRLVGRKRDLVVYANKYFAVNARYLYKAFDALNATKVYFSQRNKPLVIYENDDVTSINKVFILPIIDNSGKLGFHTTHTIYM